VSARDPIGVEYPEIGVRRGSGPRGEDPGVLGTDIQSPDVHLRQPAELAHRASPSGEDVDLDMDQILELKNALDAQINQHPDNLPRSERKGPKGFLLGELFGFVEEVAEDLGYGVPEPFYNPISALSGPKSQKLVLTLPGKELPTPVGNAMIYVSWTRAGPKGHRVKVHVDLDVTPTEGG
jgi:hypothetical protein